MTLGRFKRWCCRVGLIPHSVKPESTVYQKQICDDWVLFFTCDRCGPTTISCPSKWIGVPVRGDK